MTVWHYLFWVENNQISAILKNGKKFEIIKFGISQSSCFIEDDPLKGQNKGQIRPRERTIT